MKKLLSIVVLCLACTAASAADRTVEIVFDREPKEQGSTWPGTRCSGKNV